MFAGSVGASADDFLEETVERALVGARVLAALGERLFVFLLGGELLVVEVGVPEVPEVLSVGGLQQGRGVLGHALRGEAPLHLVPDLSARSVAVAPQFEELSHALLQLEVAFINKSPELQKVLVLLATQV